MSIPTLLLTGATDGIGLAAAPALAAHGCRLFLHGRTPARVEAAVAAVRSVVPDAQVEGVVADFSRLAEVRRLAFDLGARTDHLDVLLANAGVFMTERVVTEDGFETSFQVSHVAHLLLIRLLEPLLRAAPAPRVVQVASTSHLKVQAVNPANLDWHEGFAGYPAYGLAKLGQVAATLDLAKRWPWASVNAIHPGSILTKLQVTGWGGDGRPDPSEAVDRLVRHAFAPELGGITGGWFVQDRLSEPNPLARSARAALLDLASAKA